MNSTSYPSADSEIVSFDEFNKFVINAMTIHEKWDEWKSQESIISAINPQNNKISRSLFALFPNDEDKSKVESLSLYYLLYLQSLIMSGNNSDAHSSESIVVPISADDLD